MCLYRAVCTCVRACTGVGEIPRGHRRTMSRSGIILSPGGVHRSRLLPKSRVSQFLMPSDPDSKWTKVL